MGSRSDDEYWNQKQEDGCQHCSDWHEGWGCCYCDEEAIREELDDETLEGDDD